MNIKQAFLLQCEGADSSFSSSYLKLGPRIEIEQNPKIWNEL